MYQQDLQIEAQVSNPQVLKSKIHYYAVFELHAKDQTGNFSVKRTYNDFFLLREALCRRWPGCYVPGIPGRKQKNNSDVEYYENQTKAINLYLQRIISRPYLYFSQEFHTVFLQSKNEDITKELQEIHSVQASDMFQIYHQYFTNLDGKKVTVDLVHQIQSFKEKIQKIKQSLKTFKYTLKELSTNDEQLYKDVKNLVLQSIPNHQKIYPHPPSQISQTQQQSKRFDKIFDGNSLEEALDIIRIGLKDYKCILQVIEYLNTCDANISANDKRLKELQIQEQNLIQNKFQFQHFFGVVNPATQKEQIEQELKKVLIEAEKSKQLKTLIIANIFYNEIPTFEKLKIDSFKQLMLNLSEREKQRLDQEILFWEDQKNVLDVNN